MSAPETPLVTPDELNKILTRENAELRAREKVAKEANDKMRADLAAALAELARLRIALKEANESDQKNQAIILDAMREHDALRAQLANAEARVKELEAEVADARRTYMELVTDGNAVTLAQSLQRAEARVRELEADCLVLQARLGQAEEAPVGELGQRFMAQLETLKDDPSWNAWVNSVYSEARYNAPHRMTHLRALELAADIY